MKFRPLKKKDMEKTIQRLGPKPSNFWVLVVDQSRRHAKARAAPSCQSCCCCTCLLLLVPRGILVICAHPKKKCVKGRFFFCFSSFGGDPEIRKICGELFVGQPWICFKILFLHGGITKSSRKHPLEKIILLFFWKWKRLLFLWIARSHAACGSSSSWCCCCCCGGGGGGCCCCCCCCCCCGVGC